MFKPVHLTLGFPEYEQRGGGDTAIKELKDLRTLQLYFKADTAKKVLDLFRQVVSITGKKLHAKTMTTKQTNDIKRWNEFIKTLETESANGIVNLAQIAGKENLKFIIKTDIGRYSDPIRYEYHVGLIVNELREYIPNFMLTFGAFECNTVLKKRTDAKAKAFQKERNKTLKRMTELCPVQKGNKGEMKNFIMLELITSESEKKTSFSDYCQNVNSVQEYLDGLIQVLCALEFGQNKFKFTHYDLHADNVMLQKMDTKSKIFVYHFKKNKKSKIVAVKADVLMVLIDFGRSHTVGIDPSILKLWTVDMKPYVEELFFNKLGIRPWMFKSCFDLVRIFLHSLWYLPKKIKKRLKPVEDYFKNTEFPFLNDNKLSQRFDALPMNKDKGKTGMIESPLDFVEYLFDNGYWMPTKAEDYDKMEVMYVGYPLTKKEKEKYLKKIRKNNVIATPKSEVNKTKQRPSQSGCIEYDSNGGDKLKYLNRKQLEKKVMGMGYKQAKVKKMKSSELCAIVN